MPALRSLGGNGAASRDGIWLDRVVGPLGFDWLSAKVPWNIPPSVLYAVLAVLITNGLLASYTVLTGGTLVYATNPYYLLEILLLPAAVIGAHSLHRDYDRAMEEMNIVERTSNPEVLLEIVPRRLPWSLFGIAVGIMFLFPGPVSTYGVTAMVDNFVILPFVYAPIVVQFFTTYFAIEILAPVRLWNSDIGIDFLDPEGIGGLRPIGELIKKSYYYIAVGLVGYALITYAPFIDWGWTVSPEANLLFTSIWIVSIGGVAFGVLVLHRFMHREKREAIRQLKAELRTHITNRYDVEDYEVPDSKEATVDELEERISRVNNTSEYPASFSIWSQLLVSIALPKGVQLLVAGL
jgi:hypothetical protein